MIRITTEVEMDIKETLLNIVQSDSARYSYMAAEKLITVMLQDYAEKQNKEVLIERNYPFFDMVFPNGIDDISGKVAVEIKFYRHKQMFLKFIYDTIGRVTMNNGDINTLLLIAVNEIPERMVEQIQEKKANLNFNLLIWDIDKLTEIFSQNESLFFETYNNLHTVILKDTINSSISSTNESYIEKRKKHIEQLKTEYENDNIVLFLGAGASHDAHISTWDNLISELFVALIDKQLKNNHIQIGEREKQKIIKALIEQNGSSPLLQTRFLRNGFEDDFEELVSQILYKKAVDTSSLLEEIGQLCVPNRGKWGIRAIINYNFDDLIEKNLKRLRVKHQSIYSEGMIPDSGELGIYHVHGFLPQDKKGYDNLAKSLLVFSEEGYHKLMLEPYNWANITQLNYMTNNTCVFIGLSMTDPNMRRLLEIAAQKRGDIKDNCKHYAIMRRFTIASSDDSSPTKSFENVNEALQESFFKELGINIIWYDDFPEIPGILKQIKDS